MIREHFVQSIQHYTTGERANVYWEEIAKHYTASGRHYHTLTHLNHLLQELLPHRQAFKNWDTIVFAIAYHDIIYNTLRRNNEEKSAAFAARVLRETSFPESEIETCLAIIRATQNHEPADAQTNLFTDADLAILGASPQQYENYIVQIRREYRYYPDLLYIPGRKKVLRHFLGMKSIYKTDIFHRQYEAQARINMKNELAVLT